MIFSFSNYRAALRSGDFRIPAALAPYHEISPARYDQLERRARKAKHTIAKALTHVRNRTGQSIFEKIYLIQSHCLDHSARAFPAYRFLLPEMIADDWLATVDWRHFQRDHVVHQSQVAYVALGLLRDLKIQGTPLFSTCLDRVYRLLDDGYLRKALTRMGIKEEDPYLQSPFRERLWPSVFRETLCLAALFHDIGYPWQYANRIESKLAYDGRHPITPTPAATLSAYADRLVLLPFENYNTTSVPQPSSWPAEKQSLIKYCLEESHGLPGALFFLYLNDCLRLYPSESSHPVRRLCVEWAAMAILMHDMKDVYWGKNGERPRIHQLRLRFDVDPLSTVLTLADIIQDFERHSAVFAPNPRASRDPAPQMSAAPDSHSMYAIPCREVEVTFDDATKTLRINYKMANAAEASLKQAHLIKEQHQFFDPAAGFVDLSACGVDHVQMRASVAQPGDTPVTYDI